MKIQLFGIISRSTVRRGGTRKDKILSTDITMSTLQDIYDELNTI